MKVGILTSGGDCPGLNAVIRASARRLLADGHEPVGLLRGYEGLAERNHTPLDEDSTSGILHVGGTMLSTSSFDPLREPDGLARVEAAQAEDGLDGVIAIGGDHTMRISGALHERIGLPVVGVPKTIDNDVAGTDYTFGFDTAVQVACDGLDRLHSTAESHDRVMVLEVMGRDAGWIALFAALAGGGDGLVIPELPFPVERLAQRVCARHERGRRFSIIVVSEGAELVSENGAEKVRAHDETDEYGYERLGGIGEALAGELGRRTGYETRAVALGHLQRGGTPTATDRILATRYGVKAAEMVLAGDFGSMAAVRGTEMTSVPLSEVDGIRPVDERHLELARTLFG